MRRRWSWRQRWWWWRRKRRRGRRWERTSILSRHPHSRSTIIRVRGTAQEESGKEKEREWGSRAGSCDDRVGAGAQRVGSVERWPQRWDYRSLGPWAEITAVAALAGGGARTSQTLPSTLLPAHSIIHLLPLLLMLTRNKRNCFGDLFSCRCWWYTRSTKFREVSFTYCLVILTFIERSLSEPCEVSVIKSLIFQYYYCF